MFVWNRTPRPVPNFVGSPTELAEHLYESGSDRDPNAIEVIVARLRRKLGNDVIETRRGFGYFVPDWPP